MIEVLHSSNTKTPTTQKNYANEGRVKELRETVASTSNVNLRKKGNQNVDQLSNLDHVATNENSSQCNTAVHFGRQGGGGDQDDHQRTKSYDETRV